MKWVVFSNSLKSQDKGRYASRVHEIRQGAAIFRFLRPSVSLLRGTSIFKSAQKQHLQN